MLDFFSRLFASDFMPYGHCYFWTPSIVWLNVVSDALITLAYYSIPLTLIHIVRKRSDVAFPAMYLMFGGFIAACGTTHLMEIWNVWHGTYRLTGIVKAVTALLSVATAIALVKLVPTALALGNRKEMATINAALAHEITERKRSEAALEHERYLLRALMDQLPDRIYFKDRESRFLRNNRAQLRRFGLTDQAQTLGKTDRDFYPADHSQRAFQDEQTVMSTGRTLNQEEKLTGPDGREDWAMVTKMPLLDQSGQIVGTFGISRDITELKRSETELLRAREGLEMRVQQRTQELEAANATLKREIAERLRAEEKLLHTLKEITVLEAALNEHAIVAITDPQGRISYVNDKFCAISKYSRAELLGQDHGIINSRYHSKVFIRELWTTIGAGRVWKGEIRNRAKDGSYYWVDTTIVPFLNAQGEPYQYVAIRSDITERKHTEIALRQSEEHVRHVLDAALDAVVVIDVNGRITHWNPQAEAIFGWAMTEVVQKKLSETIIPPRYREAHERGLKHYLDTGVGPVLKKRIEITGLHRDGREFPVELSITPAVAQDEVFFSAFIRDITDRKHAEAALKDSLREKETLLKETHHRVKNNLQLISSLLQLQSGYISDPGALTIFRDGQNRIRSMALIHEKLYQSSSLARIDLAEYVRSLTSMLVHTYHTHTSQVSLHLEVESVSLNLDTAIPLGLMLNELISNCLEHAFPDQRAGVIRVALHRAADGLLTLTVQDNGVGLPTQLDWENTPSLGLRLIRILVEQLHGSVEIRRQPGTTVTLTTYELKTRERT